MTQNSLSGSWHNIKNAAQERAKRWALGVHSASMDSGEVVKNRRNGEAKCLGTEVGKPLLTNSVGTQENALDSEFSGSQNSIRVYWSTPETHL
jgi:hypothetical protein